jgi:hypothetical protein
MVHIGPEACILEVRQFVNGAALDEFGLRGLRRVGPDLTHSPNQP